VPATDTNVPNQNLSLAGGAIHKWDVTQAVRAKVISDVDLTGITPANLWADARNYPSDLRVGNDDQWNGGESGDPYQVGHYGQMRKEDNPKLTLPTSFAKNQLGVKVEVRWQFKDFCRVLIGNKWYEISDDYLWQADYKWKFVGPEPAPSSLNQNYWKNDNSLMSFNNDNW